MNPIKVLIVEDSPNERITYQMLLESAGYEVTTAVDAEEAFELFKLFKPYVVLSDYKLGKPDENGVFLMTELVKRYPREQFAKIYMTGYGEDFLKDKTDDYDHYFEKTSDIVRNIEIGIRKFEAMKALILRGYVPEDCFLDVSYKDKNGKLQKEPIPLSKIVFLESETVGKTTRVKFHHSTRNRGYFRSYDLQETLNKIEKLGYSGFVRVHKGFAVNRAFMNEIEVFTNYFQFTLKDDSKRIYLGESYTENIDNLRKYKASIM